MNIIENDDIVKMLNDEVVYFSKRAENYEQQKFSLEEKIVKLEEKISNMLKFLIEDRRDFINWEVKEIGQYYSKLSSEYFATEELAINSVKKYFKHFGIIL